MHELAIAEAILDAILERTHQRQVTVVRLAVGKLSGVVPHALEFCFDLATNGTPVEGASLEIVQQHGRARCHACGGDFDVFDLILLCPCGSADVEVVAGRELSVTSVEVV
ncbi:MAG: hydrogenase maturation nickel metallochaperone HypA [Ornithinibacter sp.]